MSQAISKKLWSWAGSVVVVSFVGVCFWLLNDPGPASKKAPPSARQGDNAQAEPERGLFSALSGPGLPEAEAAELPRDTDVPRHSAVPDPVALRYARAYQDGRWDEVIDLTAWMQERLARVKREAGLEAAARARMALRERLGRSDPVENQLTPEGVGNRYVLAKGALLEAVLVDAGPTDLERPARSRSWFRMTFPDRAEALRDESGIPIRSLLVGVSVSTEGLVMKASVAGDLELDLQSVAYDWDRADEEE